MSQLALRGYDANMTLGRTKGVDILASHPETGRMLKIEVKTNYRSSRSAGGNSSVFGKFTSAWLMNSKAEAWEDKSLFYCFVNILPQTSSFRFYVIPSGIVADYLRREHKLWLKHRGVEEVESQMRTFRICSEADSNTFPTPTVEKYENNWAFEIQ